MNDERRRRWRSRTSIAHATARLAARSDRLRFQRKGVSPAVPSDHIDRQVPKWPIPRIVMRDGRDAGQKILQSPDEQAIGQGISLIPPNRRVGPDREPHVIDPRRCILVALAPLLMTV